jgi:hypothetical protein
MTLFVRVAIIVTALFLERSFAQELRDYMPPTGLGTAMYNAQDLTILRHMGDQIAMNRIEALGLYAVATKTIDEPAAFGNGRGGGWLLQKDEVFPFLGFDGAQVRLKVGEAWFSEPRDAVNVVEVSDHPEFAARYRAIMEKDRAEQAAARQQEALDESNARLKNIQEEQRKIQQQLQLLQLRQRP